MNPRMLARVVAVASIISVGALSGCAAVGTPDGGTVLGTQPGTSCMSLPFAGEFQAEVDGTAELTASEPDFDEADPTLFEIGCTIKADDDSRGIGVAFLRQAEACESKVDLFTPDPGLAGGAYATATNGGIGYWLCTASGAEAVVTYISGQDVEGPSLEEMRGWTQAAADSESIFAAIAEAGRPAADAESDADEPAEGCEALPAELAAVGLELPGCLLGVESNDSGGVTVFLQADGPDAFSAVSDQLEGVGLETVFCEDGPDGGRFCGWSSEMGWNANVEFRPVGSADNPYDVDVVEVETWGFAG